MTGRPLVRVRNNDRGAVLPVVALSLVVLMVMTAFSVDIGRQILRRRQAQAVADVVALDMARLIDGRTTSAIQSDSRWDQTRVNATTRNDFPTGGVTAVLGHWEEATSTFTATSSGQIPDAVQVNASDVVDFYFARVIGVNTGNVNRTAVATAGPPTCTPPPDCPGTRALGELGSVFAGFQFYADPGFSAEYNAAADMRAKVLNSTLYTQFGISGGVGMSGPPVGLNLDALSYKGISNGSVLLGDLAAAAGFGSVNDLMSATITARGLLTAMVTAMQNSGNSTDIAAATQIAKFAGSASSSLTLRLGDLISVAQGDTSSAANYRVDALDLIAGSGELINGKNFFSTTITTSIPGVPTAPIRVAIIETPQQRDGIQGDGPCTPPLRPELWCGPKTAQVRVATSIPITLNLTPFGVPLIQATTIPIVIEAASAESFFKSIKCGQPTSASSTDFRVVTNGVAMHIGSVTDAALQSTSTLSLQAQALLHGSIALGFPPVTIDLDASTSVKVSRTFKNGAVLSGDIESNSGVLGANETHTFVGDTQYNILPTSWRYDGGVGATNVSNTVFSNLGITNPVLNAAVQGALQSQLANFDKLFIDPVLSSLGVTLAGADGAIRGVYCTVRLVN